MVAIYFTALFSNYTLTQFVGWIYLIFAEKVPEDAEEDSDDLYDESEDDSDTSDSDSDEEDSEVQSMNIKSYF